MAYRSKGFLGDTNIGVFKLGDSDVKLYLGDMKVYPLSPKVFITYDVATYNGTLQTAQNIVVTDESGNTLVENVDYVVTENNGGTNAGTYNLIITLMGQYQGTERTNFVINKVTPTVTAPTAKVLTYNTQAQELVNAGSTDYGTLKYSIDNSTWSTSIPTAINYGSYTVYYKVEGDSNVNDVAAQSVACSINEKQVTATVELSQNTYTYNGSACQPAVTVKDGSTVIDPSEYTVAYSNNINVGTATVTINDNTGGNYEVIGSATFTINKVTPTVTAPTAKVLTYNSQAQELVNAGSTDYGTLKYSIDGTNYSTMIPSVTTAGSYIVYYKVDGDSNINDVAAQSIACSIAKASGSVTTAPTAKNLTYDGSSQALVNTGSGTGTMLYNLGGGSWSTDIPSATTAGTYTVYYKASASTNYEESSSGSVNCVIAKADSSLSFTVTDLTVAPGDTKQNIVTVNAGDGVVTYTSNNTSVVTVNNSGVVTGVSVGSTTVSANISSTNNYNSATTSYNANCIVAVTANFNLVNPGRVYILNSTNGFTKIEVDGVEQPSVTTDYTFNTTGEHTVKYYLNGSDVANNAFNGCSSITSVTIGDGVTSIGDNTFERCTSLENISISDSVTGIGQSTFRICESLVSVNIPDSVTSIGQYAFSNCINLTGCTIGSGLTTIGKGVFNGCRNLITIDIPSGVTSISEEVLFGCSGLTSCTIGSNVTYIDDGAFWSCNSLKRLNSDTDGIFNIPSGVTSVNNNTFIGCYEATSINVPSGVTRIGGSAFDGCKSLTTVGPVGSNSSVEIPSGVTSINAGAFDDCSGLTSVVIPDTITSVGIQSFRNCSSLTSCTIGSGVTSIGSNAFLDCTSLSSITVNSTTPPTLGSDAFGYTNNCPIYVPCDSVDAYKAATNWSTYASRIQAIAGSCSITNAVVTCDSATYDGTVHTAQNIVVTLNGNTLAEGTDYTVTSNTGGTNAGEYPVTITGAGNYRGTASGTFTINKADSLLSFAVNDIGVKTRGTKSNLVNVRAGDGAINYISDDTSIVIVDNRGNVTGLATGDTTVTAIIESSANYNSASTRYNVTTYDENWLVVAKINVTDTTNPTKITSNYWGITKSEIDGVEQTITSNSYTFSTTGEHTVRYNTEYDGRTYYGYVVNCFEECPNLTKVLISDYVKAISDYAFRKSSGMTSCIIGDGVTSIGDYAFSGCTSLTSCTIGSGVTSIGGYAFHGCNNLTSINIPNSVTSIGQGVFTGCTNLTSIIIPDSVTSMAGGVFLNCYSLSSCTIGSGVTLINDSTFSSCRSLTSVGPVGSGASVEIPSGVTSIGYHSFDYCEGLTSVTIPDTVTSIGQAAFYNCSSLTNLTIGSGITSISGSAFNYCESLVSVTCNAVTPPTISSGVFYQTNDCPIYVPCDSVEAYKAAQYWSDYASRIQAIDRSCL